jgi:hypothetical protein
MSLKEKQETHLGGERIVLLGDEKILRMKTNKKIISQTAKAQSHSA